MHALLLKNECLFQFCSFIENKKPMKKWSLDMQVTPNESHRSNLSATKVTEVQQKSRKYPKKRGYFFEEYVCCYLRSWSIKNGDKKG